MPEQSTFSLINELIIAISKILWPIITFILVLIFKGSIENLLSRMKRGNFFGQEMEFEQEMNDFIDSVSDAEKEVYAVDKEKSIETSKNNNIIQNILEEASREPRVGIMLLSIEIEKELRTLMGVLGLLNQYEYRSPIKAFDLFEKRGSLPPNTIHSVKQFWNIRNKIIHGKINESREKILRVLDIGISLLKMLKAIPHEKNVVAHSEVNIYKDSNCEFKYNYGKGLILKTISNNGETTNKRIFPTTKNNYKKEMQVTWEWSDENKWNEAWYIDPDSGEIKYGWSESLEFVGKDINKLK
jgi:hypothetical protein